MTMRSQPDEAVLSHWIAVWTCLTMGLVSINASIEVNSTASVFGIDRNSNSSVMSTNSTLVSNMNTTVPYLKNTTVVVNNTTPLMTSTEFLPVSNTTLAAMVVTTPKSVNFTFYINIALSSSLGQTSETFSVQEVTSSKLTTDTFETNTGDFVTSEHPAERSDPGFSFTSSSVIQEATTMLKPLLITFATPVSVSSVNASFSIPEVQETMTPFSSESLQSSSELLLATQTLPSVSAGDKTSPFQSSSLPSSLVQDSGSSFGLTRILRIIATTSVIETVSQIPSALIIPMHSSVQEKLNSSATVSSSQEMVSASQDSGLSSQEIKASSEDAVSLTQELISSNIELLSTKMSSEADVTRLHSMQAHTFVTTSVSSSQTILLTSDVVVFPVESTSIMISTPSFITMASSFVSVESSSSIDVKPTIDASSKSVSHIISPFSSAGEISSSELIAEHIISTTSFEIRPTSVYVASTLSSKTLELPSSSKIMPSTNATILSTTATSMNRSYHRVTNISFEIQFIGVCDPLVQRKIVLEEFWGYLVIAISTMLQVEKMKIKPKDIACNPIRITFTILDITHPNTTHVLTDFVASGRFTFKLPVLLEDTESKFTYEATSVKIVPPNYDINGGVDTYEMGLSEVDIIVIISACCVSIVLICVGCCICMREYYLRKRSRSFDLSDIVNFNLKLEDYTLTKIPRAKPFYSDGGVKMQSFTRKNGQQTKALLEQDEISADDTTNENGSLIKELQVRMNQHSDGILIGITKTNMPSASPQSPELSPCELKDQSKEMLYEHNASPTHCMDNPIYYADDDRFAKV